MPKAVTKKVSFDEYKLLYERTEKLSERRQAASQIYLTINTAIFGGIAFLAKDLGFHGWLLTAGLLGLFGFGILICSIWRKILINTENFLKWQYERLCEMEKGIPDSFQLFTKENKDLYTAKPGEEKASFSLLEAQLPMILMIVYGVCVLATIIATWSGGL